jgi:hypothetical protein
VHSGLRWFVPLCLFFKEKLNLDVILTKHESKL